MDNAQRADVYRRQRGTGLVPILTDRQRRRLRKHHHKGKGRYPEEYLKKNIHALNKRRT